MANNNYKNISEKNALNGAVQHTIKYRSRERKKSDDVTGQVFCDDPVTVMTTEALWQDLEFTLDRLICI